MSSDRPAAGEKAGFAYGVRAALPLCVALVAFGASFGVLARANGFGVMAPIVMSLTTFTGASQFATVSILDGGGRRGGGGGHPPGEPVSPHWSLGSAGPPRIARRALRAGSS
ncbi:MAG: AzlC family ABC transporter permease [Dehalococcoidia bacterium]|uniref:AzlC family ABC transporter permease n=1 Tax=Candidatus Amarobacter glycogenicus TaxID=3140699 RepID=UPI0031350139|nr:AzlC family ABC transporter permease [Dehalococcoidia bacterium]